MHVVEARIDEMTEVVEENLNDDLLGINEATGDKGGE